MTVKQTVTVLDTAITELADRISRQAEQLDRAAKRVAELEQVVARTARVARGTTPPAPVEAAPARARRATVAPPPSPHHVGDDTPTPVLNAAVEALLRERPLERRELVQLTGARTNRVAGAIVHLQRHGVPIVRDRAGKRSRWYILPR